MKKAIILTLTISTFAGLISCSGRTDKNMTPTGETIEVVIPTPDVEEDAAIANGGAAITTQSATDTLTRDSQ